jgi:hypothetical protein
MADYRVLINQTWTDSLPRDTTANVLHFLHPTAMSDAEEQDLVDDIKAAYNANTVLAGRGVRVKLYNLADTKPRPIRAESYTAPAQSMNSLGNRDVALCLSFFAARNLPRWRGRIYLGPLSSSYVGTMRPTSGVRTDLGALAPLFAAAGPASLAWGVYSTRDNVIRHVTDWYIDDEWDTMRKRGVRSTTRTTGTVTA